MRLIFILFFLTSTIAQAQVYIALDGSFFKKDPVNFGGSADFHFGGVFSKSFNAGIGTGLYFFGSEEPYIPVFIEAGYLDNNKKISPYLLGRLGYSLSNGSAGIFTPGKSTKATLYSNIRAGVGLKNKKVEVVLFGGLLLLNHKENIMYADGVPKYSTTLFNAGFSIVGFRN